VAFSTDKIFCGPLGSGCIAALEAERYLAEQEGTADNLLEAGVEAKKGDLNSNVPEYRSNPLL
jgi:hypothetical protein